MISTDRMAAVDRNAEALGVPRKQLMESSGNAIARTVREIADPTDSVVLVCGRGNNGGDAMVAARFLETFDPRTVLVGHPDRISTTIARENWDALTAADYPVRTIQDSTDVDEIGLHEDDVVVDAMLGTGITGSLREPAASVAASINRCGATVISVDVPSGVDADTGERGEHAVNADHVVTFHDAKPALEMLDVCVTIADIGIPSSAERFVGPGDLPDDRRDPDSHKGDHGSVLVIGGGPYTGAPALSGQAALRSGADLATVLCPSTVADTVQSFDESLIVRSVDGDRFRASHAARALRVATDADAVVIGPGMGRAEATIEFVRSFLEGFDGRAVVDADPLGVVPELDTSATLLCTPHRGELTRMGRTVSDDREETERVVEAFAAEIGATILLKGTHDVVSDGETTRVNRTGTPSMTVGGTGDVLAGVAGGLLCNHEPMCAAAVAAYANGRAGEAADRHLGGGDADRFQGGGDADRLQVGGLRPTDLLDRLPAALRDDGTDRI